MNRTFAGLVAIVMIAAVANSASAATVSVRPDGKLIVDGKPFLPFGFFANVGEPMRDLNAVGQNGFNTAYCNNICDNAYYARAASLGVKVIHEIWWPGPKASVESVRNKSPLIAYYVADDVNISANDGCASLRYSPAQVLARSNQIRSYDLTPPLGHFTAAGIVLAPECRVGEFARSASMLMGYNYPIGNWGPSTEWLQWNVDATKQLVSACSGGKCSPVMVNQTWHWPWGRMPTAGEVRNMNYASLIYGAAGIIMYTISDDDSELKQDPWYYLPVDGPSVWAETKAQAKEIRRIAPMLLDGKRTVLSVGRANLAVWTQGTKTLVIAANTDRTRSLRVDATLPAGATGGLRPAFTRLPATLTNSRNRLSGDLPRDAVQIYSNYL